MHRASRPPLSLARYCSRLLGALLPAALVGSLLAACDSPDRVAGPTIAQHHGTADGVESVGTPTGIVRLRLEEASAGLTYTSESDRPFTWYFRAGPVPTTMTIDAFRATLGIPPTVNVETRDLDEFFARHIEWVDPYDATAMALVPRYTALRETLRNVLREPLVFRVGRIAIDCYIVGFDRAGNLVGLRTVAIET